MLYVLFVLFAATLVALIYRSTRTPFVISRWGTPLAYWYSFEPDVLRLKSVRRYKRDERFVTHDTSYSVSFRAITGGMVL